MTYSIAKKMSIKMYAVFVTTDAIFNCKLFNLLIESFVKLVFVYIVNHIVYFAL